MQTVDRAGMGWSDAGPQPRDAEHIALDKLASKVRGMRSEILLLGPVRTGKSTLAGLLAQQLGMPRVSLDEMRWRYYEEIGYDAELAQTIRQRGGFLALVLYWQLFDAYSVERVLAEHPHCVIDFGAGVGVYESQEQFARVQRALAAYRNVFLILPSPDRVESLQILRERDEEPPSDLNFDFNAHFLAHHGYYDLAKFTVYTKGRTPTETCAEIVALAGR
jgi:shikimate kinase